MKIAVKDQLTTLLRDDTLIQNAEKIYIAEFIFDEKWDGFAKTAVFEAGSVHVEVPLSEDRCIVPAQCLEQAGVKLNVGVFGRKSGMRKNTSWCLTGMILRKASLGPFTPSSPNPGLPEDVYAQIIEVIRAHTATDPEVDAVLKEVFGASSGQPVDPGTEHPDNTATDKEVEDILNDVFGR